MLTGAAAALSMGSLDAVPLKPFRRGIFRTRFDPIAFLGPNLLAYWDAEALDTLTLAGSNVTSWADRKNGYTGIQTVSGSKPAWSAAAINNRPAVVCDGTDDYLELALPSGWPVSASPVEIWALVTQEALAADVTIRDAFAYGNSGVARRLGRSVVSGVSRGRFTANSSAVDSVVDLTGTHILQGIYSGTQSQISVDGNALTSFTITATTVAPIIRIGAATTTLSSYWQGGINAIIVGTAFSAAQRAQILAFLKARGGIA